MTDSRRAHLARAEPEAAVPAAPSSRRPPPRAALILAISIAVVLGVLSIALAVTNARDDGEGGRVKAPASRRRAGRPGAAHLRLQGPRGPQGRACWPSPPGRSAPSTSKAFDQGLGELITKVKATSKGFVKDVYVSEIDAERAEAIVVADVTRDGAGGKRTLYDIYILLSFVEVKGTWKVDQVTDLNFAQAGGGESTTSTSVPVP